MPHSGTYIPTAIRKQFILPTPVLANNDWYLSRLYDFLYKSRITCLVAHHSRYTVDLNRNAARTKLFGKYRQHIVYSHTTFGEKLYDHDLSIREIQNRIDLYYIPYHAELKGLLEEKIKHFGRAVLLDLHSGCTATGDKDICLANAKGKTCPPALMENLKAAFETQGFSVNINTPVTGGHIIRQHYGDNVDAIM
ncbi:MAG: N-formylglutamate amidohydrolase, partial [Lactobacillales bacterium]|nr:N-formylglutamate amidohydrolase [Lactobacillales bacterium]